MSWEQTKYGPALPGPTMSATVRETDIGYVARIASSSLINNLPTEQEAKEWAEARMNEIKKEFILSLIVKITSREYNFGGLLCIANVKDDIWRVSNEREYLFQGTLEECKNYIVECF